MIFLTGATGSVGFELVKNLSNRGIKAKAMVRSAAGAEKLAGLAGIERVLGDFDDPVSLDRVLQGSERVFLLTNSSERAEAQQLAFVAAAKRAGVRHIVKLSQLHADPQSPVRFLRYHAVIERAIRDSGMAYTFLRPNLFMQALLAFRQTIVDDGKFFAPIGQARISLVDIRDIAAIAVEALTAAGHEGRIYDITGPEAVTHGEIADRMGQAIGRPVAFIDIPPMTMREAVIAVGFPQWQADGLLEDYAHYARGEAMGVSADVLGVTGRQPRSLESFLDDYRDVLKRPA